MTEAIPEFSPQFEKEFEQLLSWRRDVRTFKQTPLAADLVGEILAQALTYAPSVGNSQPWRVVRVNSGAIRQTVRDHVEEEHTRSAKIYDDETGRHFNRLKLHGLDTAPEQFAFFSVSDPSEGRGLGRQTMPETLVWSTVMAIHTLWLATRVKGVGLGWVSILQPAKMNEILDCPQGWRFVAYLCMGYPAIESQTPELVREDWQARLPIEDLVVSR